VLPRHNQCQKNNLLLDFDLGLNMYWVGPDKDVPSRANILNSALYPTKITILPLRKLTHAT